MEYELGDSSAALTLLYYYVKIKVFVTADTLMYDWLALPDPLVSVTLTLTLCVVSVWFRIEHGR